MSDSKNIKWLTDKQRNFLKKVVNQYPFYISGEYVNNIITREYYFDSDIIWLNDYTQVWKKEQNEKNR